MRAKRKKESLIKNFHNYSINNNLIHSPIFRSIDSFFVFVVGVATIHRYKIERKKNPKSRQLKVEFLYIQKMQLPNYQSVTIILLIRK